MESKESFVKIYCSCCGKWVGVSEKQKDLSGIYVFCKGCKRNTPISFVKNVVVRK